jgi:hypothetical protein
LEAATTQKPVNGRDFLPFPKIPAKQSFKAPKIKDFRVIHFENENKIVIEVDSLIFELNSVSNVENRYFCFLKSIKISESYVYSLAHFLGVIVNVVPFSVKSKFQHKKSPSLTSSNSTIFLGTVVLNEQPVTTILVSALIFSSFRNYTIIKLSPILYEYKTYLEDFKLIYSMRKLKNKVKLWKKKKKQLL